MPTEPLRVHKKYPTQDAGYFLFSIQYSILIFISYSQGAEVKNSEYIALMHFS